MISNIKPRWRCRWTDVNREDRSTPWGFNQSLVNSIRDKVEADNPGCQVDIIYDPGCYTCPTETRNPSTVHKSLNVNPHIF